MTDHSPTPWRACKEGACSCKMIWSLPQDFPVFTAHSEHDAEQYIGSAHTLMADSYPDMVYASIPEATAKANATFIVRAVNSHEALFAALEELLRETLHEDNVLRNGRLKDAISQAELALSQAKGEAQ